MIEAQTGNPIQDIINGNVPLGNLATAAVWSLLNLLLAACCAISLIFLVIGIVRRRGYSLPVKVLRYATVAMAVVTVISWAILDQLQKPTAWIDAYTPVIATVFALFLVLAIIFNALKLRKADKSVADVVKAAGYVC
jgi:hypothetical protein